MPSDDLRRYPPTARRLERLRQAGVAPHSPAITGLAVLLAGTLALAAGGRAGLQGLAAMLARDLQVTNAASASAEQLRALLTGHLEAAGLALAVIALGAAGVACLAHLAQTGFLLRSPFTTPFSGLPGRSPVGRQAGPNRSLLPLASVLAGLVAAVALLGAFLASGSAWVTWWRWLAVLGGLAMLHLLAAGARYSQQARLTHREMQDEARETEGSWLTRHRRDTRRRRERGHV
jgi:flagellar biosynthesis protein FlhB